MAKSVAEKLLIKPGTTVWSSSPARLKLIEPLPEGVTVAKAMDKAATALVIAEGADPLRKVLDKQKAALAKPAALWVLYPKANKADINRDTLWPILTDYGLRPITQIAVDETWSALRFRPLKEGEEFNPAKK